jgi:hypothetical protein
MASPTIDQQLVKCLSRMPTSQKRQLPEYARTLSARQTGVKGSDLLSFANAIPSEDLKDIQAGIQADCEVVDVNGW